MLKRIEQIAARLAAQGIIPGQRIAILSEPRPEFVTLTLACWKLGAVIVPLSTRCPPGRLRMAWQSVGCKRLFVSPTAEHNAQLSLHAAADNLNPSTHAADEMSAAVHLISDYVPASDLAPLTLDERALDLNADASIIFTSGTSGRPKGVLHTLANHYYNALGSHDNIPFGTGDGWLASLSMYHVGGFSLIMRALIAAGRILFPDPNQSLAEAVMHPDVTHLSLVPTQLIRLLDEPACVGRLKRLKAILLGGDAIPPTLLDRACDLNLPVSITYGSTEAASQIATSVPHRPRDGAKVLAYRDVKIATDGEICVKGPVLFKGYVRHDSIDLARDSEGWFHTGDTGTLDENGTIRVTGRKDLMFISGGENIHPEEIERALLSLPDIEQAAVVPVPDPYFSHRPVAFIRTRAGKTLDRNQLQAELANHLERFKIPKAFLPWPAALSDSPKPPRSRLAELAAISLRA